jgi:hypothetical protein
VVDPAVADVSVVVVVVVDVPVGIEVIPVSLLLVSSPASFSLDLSSQPDHDNARADRPTRGLRYLVIGLS